MAPEGSFLFTYPEGKAQAPEGKFSLNSFEEKQRSGAWLQKASFPYIPLRKIIDLEHGSRRLALPTSP